MRVTWNQLTNGFPKQLRDYEPKSPKPEPLRRPVSPEREQRSMEQHVLALRSARTERNREMHEMRISNHRRELTPDPWLESSFNRKASCAVMSKSRSRSIAGAANPVRCREMCSEVAPTIPDSDAGWVEQRRTQRSEACHTPSRSGASSPSRNSAVSTAASVFAAPQKVPQTPRSRKMLFSCPGTGEVGSAQALRKSPSHDLNRSRGVLSPRIRKPTRSSSVDVKPTPLRQPGTPAPSAAAVNVNEGELCQEEGCQSPASNALDGRRLCRKCLFYRAAVLCCD